MVNDILKNCREFCFHGAQVVAYGAYKAISKLHNRTPEQFIVSTLDGNPREIDGIPVRTLNGINKDTLVIIAVSELLQDEIAEFLEQEGYYNTFKLTAGEEHKLMSEYFSDKFPLTEKTNVTASLTLYESHCKKDKPLKEAPELKPWETVIWADDLPKNLQYCEMSAAYWIWKNAISDWVGLEHYRRHLLITPDMLSDDVDAILPLPYMCYPNTISQFRRFVSEDVLNALIASLKELHPEKYNRYMEILNGQYQYTYNLVCAKRAVYSAYCEWFFNITEYMETLADKVPEIKNTRALSYCAEVLTNIYFTSNQGRLKIRHAEKAIYT